MVGLSPDAVLPTIGSKELVAWLPTLLGVGAGDLVGIPAVAYPTYDVGARLAGATPIVVDGLAALGPLTPSTTPKVLWLNSPSNPTGAVLPVEHLAKVVAWARRHGVVVAADECYAELDWRQPDPRRPGPRHTTPSLLDPAVCGGSHEGLLAVGFGGSTYATGRVVERNARHLITNLDYGPLEWPVLSCGIGYLVVIETYDDVDATLDMKLVARQ